MQEALTFAVAALAITAFCIWIYAKSRDRAAVAAKGESAYLHRVASQRISEWKAALETAQKAAATNRDEANRELSSCRATLASVSVQLSNARKETVAAQEKADQQISSMMTKLAAASDEVSAARSQTEAAQQELQRLRGAYLPSIDSIRSDGVLLPSLVAWAHRLQEVVDDSCVWIMKHGSRPAPSAADKVREARAMAREATKRVHLLENRIALYEALAPWLLEHTDCTVEELLAGLREEEALHESHERGEDPGSTYLTAAEWKELSEDERNQLALDRYWLPSRRRSPWTAGIEYERFVGYSYEQAGFAVTYHGATLKKDDLGIDLVCKKAGVLHLVQCKRLSVQKGLPVRENVIAQTYGAAMFYALHAGLPAKSVVPAIVTTFELSETARKFAEHLGVSVRERFAFAPYPCIKCNITKDGGRIYHLPFDQQYDATAIDRDGEFYAATVAEARSRGFRRAFKWRGGAG